MVRFHDYHRTVIGYHGTRESVAKRLVIGEQPFSKSENDDDWLGHGVYFWEYAPQQAWWWARRRAKRNGWTEPIAVVASMIRLGNCLDLLDPSNVKRLQDLYEEMSADLRDAGVNVPENARQYKRLDCAVFEYAYEALLEEGSHIQTARAVYVPTDAKGRAWPHSWINKRAHIQLCVRDPSCILGTWLVKPDEEEADDSGSAQPPEQADAGPVEDRAHEDPEIGSEGPHSASC